VAPRVTVVGSINLDLVASCERLPRPGETVTGTQFTRVPGGKGANQAVASARLGADVAMVGAVGDDDFAREARSLLDRSVDVSRVRAAGGSTGVALILVEASGENEIVVAPGANFRLRPEDVDVGEADGVLCQLEIPLETVAAASETDRFFCLNVAPARLLPAELIGRADLIVANRYELEALGGPGPRLTALTLGAEGAVLLDDGVEVARAEPPTVRAVDGTAAGDAFTACLAVSLLEGRSREESLRRACAAGALAASRFGAQTSLPTAAEVEQILLRA
jgi:ribokinase